MVSQPKSEPRILLTGLQNLDRIARRFRCRLRDAALKLSVESKDSAIIGPEKILQAVPIVCRELLSDLDSEGDEESDSHGTTQEAA
jgi:hypothetical protein